MNTIKNILDFTETFAPLNSAMSFDNCGVLIGSKNATVKKAIVCLDITKDVVSEAIEKDAQLIISHHPIIFSGLKSIDEDDIPYMMIKNNLSALCLHTNLDLSETFGVNTCLAEALNLTDVKCFMDKDKEICLAIGNADKEYSEEEFAQYVKTSLNCKGVRFTNIGKTIKTVAVSSGSGGGELYFAKNSGADVLVTGEIKHNQILDANKLGISIVDAGHFKSENVVIAPFAKMLNEKFADTDFIVSETCDDFVNYL